ncbi:MAG TPA: TIGR03085 family metal-binding protein [Egicoccus sp.]|nr:TIGR03085 family metal-binding protein [Egicoccus sp.]HSK23829.1 TIGR03085 family metal-binding protein [Egicoccus sp.]
MPWMEDERAALVATARDTDPDAPTLCEGWTARHLLAHLVEREHQPWFVAVDLVSSRPPGEERFMSRLVEEAAGPAGYRSLVETFAGGPPAWSPIGLAGDRMNLVEYVVHHEDLRRAGPSPAPPRDLPAKMEAAVWRKLPAAVKLPLRKSPVGIVLDAPGHGQIQARKGELTVIVSGTPVELLLWVFGRRDVADVEMQGLPAAIERLRAWA